MSQIELCAVALAEYVAKHRDEVITSNLNEVLADESTGVGPALRTAQAQRVGPGEWLARGAMCGGQASKNHVAPNLDFLAPIPIVQADAFNRTRLRSIFGVVLRSNARLVNMPGNVLLPARSACLPKDSVANVTQIVPLGEDCLSRWVGQVSPRLMARVDAGLKRVLAL